MEVVGSGGGGGGGHQQIQDGDPNRTVVSVLGNLGWI